VMPRWAGSPPGGEPAAAPAALTPRELSAGAATAGAAAAALTPREKRTSVRVSAEGWEAASRSPSPVTRAGSSPRRAGKAGSSPPPLSVCLRKVPTPSRRATRGPRDAVRGPRDAAKTGESKAAPLPEDACEARAPLPPGVREAVDGSVQAAVRHLQRDLSALSGEFKDMCSAEWKKVMEEQWAAAWSQLEDTMRNHGASGASAGDVADLVLRSPCDGADAPPRKSPSIAPAPMSGTPLGSAAFHTPLGGVPGAARAVHGKDCANGAQGPAVSWSVFSSPARDSPRQELFGAAASKATPEGAQCGLMKHLNELLNDMDASPGEHAVRLGPGAASASDEDPAFFDTVHRAFFARLPAHAADERRAGQPEPEPAAPGSAAPAEAA